MSRVYDLAVTHHLDTDDLFLFEVQRRCAESGMRFFLIEPLWADAFFAALDDGRVWPRVLLNLHSDHHNPDELFHRIVRRAGERGSQVIDPLDAALPAFDKTRLHGRLVEAGVSVPPSRVVTAEELPGWRPGPDDVALLGRPFVVKPAMGFGRRGVILDATSELDLQRSAAAWPDHAWLLQRRIEPLMIGGEPAYWRVFYVFGDLWCCWWNCHTDRYRAVSPQEWQLLRRTPVEAMVRRIAGVTGMRFFSTEIAQTADGGFVAIDYMNDQCHLLSQSADPGKGVPDDVLRALAERLVRAARDLAGPR